MSYVVLARKYRPRRFAEMVGQEHVVQALTNALQQGRLHHAYLFTGTRGIGKTTVSRILAKSLNCTGADGLGGITAEPCGVCTACVEIDADRYMDYIELDAASNRSIDEIRDLIERAAYKPGVGRFKVFMIDEAHQLTKDAFNALLKTLEEPPEYLKFVLATTDPEKMLPTVLSRCLQFNLRPMAPETVRAHLAQVLGAEAVPFDDAGLRLLARAARGSMRDGLSLTDQAIAYGGGRLDESVVRRMLGSVDRGQARAIVDALARRDGPGLLEAVDGLRRLGLSAAGLLEEVARLLQQMAVAQAVPGALDTQDPLAADASALAPLLPPDETQLLYSIVLHGRAELQLMSDEYGALTMVLLRFLAFPAVRQGPPAVEAAGPPLAPIAAVARQEAGQAQAARAEAGRDDRHQARQEARPVRRDEPRSAARSDASMDEVRSEAGEPRAAPLRASPPPALSVPALRLAVAAPAPGSAPADPALGARWHGLVKGLSEKGALTALARELGYQGGLRAIDRATIPPRWSLVVERETLRTPALRDKLAAALAAELGHAVELELEPGVPADSPARREAAERERRQAEAEAVIHGDPVVRELLAQFKGARIVPGSIKPV